MKHPVERVKQALLPEQLEAPTIEQMVVGDTRYTVPWAMWADSERRCWLNPRYGVEPERGGTVQMGVTKSDEGYSVDISTVEDKAQWSIQERPSYVGQREDTEWIPVISIMQ